MQTSTRSLGSALFATLLLAQPAAGISPPPLVVPPARAGDILRVSVLGEGWTLTVGERTTAIDRWGRELDAFAVSVDGFHPVAFESKKVTRHSIHLDAASGTQISDMAEYVFGGEGGVSSESAAYSAFEPNDPDGWPGWAASGGLLAGRTLVPGGRVEVTFVMTNTRGASSIMLDVEEAAPEGGLRCVLAAGATAFPLFTYLTSDGIQRSSVTVAAEITQCEGSPYARRTRLTYSGSLDHTVEFATELVARGEGDAVGASPYQEPAHHVSSSPVPFGGTLRDGGSVEVPSVEAAQSAAALSPGLALWRLANPGGYLVEAEFRSAAYDGAPEPAERWRLVYAAPGGAAHEVQVAMRAPAPVALDVPRAEPYPATVPALASWPAEVASLRGAIAAWRGVAGPAARLAAVRWQPLLDQNWYVTGGVTITCDGEDCGDLYGELPIDVTTGAVGTGEHPVA